MNPHKKGYVQVRSGFIEVGDIVYVAAMAVYVEVEQSSIYLGSLVRYQHSVYRDPGSHPADPNKELTHTELCDELQEHDSVSLRVNSGRAFGAERRVVVYKDEQFIYLRKPAVSKVEASATSDRICRRTGKAWAWTPGGWEPKDWTLNKGEPFASGGFVGKGYPDGGLVGA